MAFEGDLRHLALGDVLQTLAMSRQMGTFVVRGPAEERRLVVGARGVGLLTVRHLLREVVGQYLLGRGKVAPDAYEQALRQFRRRKDGAVEDVLLEQGATTPEDVKSARHYVAAEEIYDLFLWREGTFEFVSSEGGDPPASYGDCWFDVMSLAMEAARRMDEVGRLQRTAPPEVVLRKFNESAPAPAAAEAGGEDGVRLYAAVDGARTVLDLQIEFHLGRFDTWKLLADLCEKGMLRPASSEELARTAEDLIAAKKHARAATVLRRAVQLDPENVDASRSLIAALVASEDKRGAAAEHVRLGERAIESADHSAALEHFRSAARLDPVNLSAQDGLARALFAAGDARAGCDAARQAIPLWLESGNVSRAEALADAAIRESPDDVVLRVMLANVRIAAGQPADGLLLLDDAASLLETSGDDERRLLDVYRRILQLDPQRADCARRIQEIQEREKIRRKRLAQRLAAAAAVTLVALAAVPLLKRPSLDSRIAAAVASVDTEGLHHAIGQLDLMLSEEMPDEDLAQVREARAALAAKLPGTGGPNRAERLRSRLAEPSERMSSSVTARRWADALGCALVILDMLDAPETRGAQQDDATLVATLRADAASDIELTLSALASRTMEDAAKLVGFRDRFTTEAFRREDVNVLAELVAFAGQSSQIELAEDWPAVGERLGKIRARIRKPKDGSDVKASDAIATMAVSFAQIRTSGDRALSILRKRRMLDRVLETQRAAQSLLLEGRVEDAGRECRALLDLCDEFRRAEPKELYEPIVHQYLDVNDVSKKVRDLWDQTERVRTGEETAAAELAAGRVAEAFRIRKDLVREHARIDFRSRFRLPVRIESQPPGAEVLLAAPGDEAGRVIGRTPIACVEYDLEGVTRFTLRADGFQPRTIERRGVYEDESPVVRAELTKIARFVSGPGAAVQAAPAPVGTDAYAVAARDGSVRVLGADGADGAKRSLGLRDGIAGSPVEFGGRLFVATLDGSLLLLDATDLAEKARVELSGPSRGALIAGARGVLCLDDSGALRLVNASGRVEWTAQTGRSSSEPAPWADGCAVVNSDGELVLVDGAGAARGHVRLPGESRWSSAVCEGGRAWATGDGGAVCCVDLDARSVAWTATAGASVAVRPAVSGGSVAVCATNGSILVFDAATGDVRRRATAGGPVRRPPVGLPDGAGFVVVTEKGSVVRFDAAGDILWRYDAKEDVMAPPAFVRGLVIVVTKKGVVHALLP
ncbi:MAG: Outer membrane protein assembly factor BamB [Planctomycetes bacterium]|nr:Outer membrane protein assembly factor BamB [Planctomycetota bacterium]